MSGWKLNEKAFGTNEQDFCTSELSIQNPALVNQIFSYLQINPTSNVPDILSPNRDGLLKIYPYSKIAEITESGDILVFLEPDQKLELNNDSKNVTKAVKQRGWHNDLIVKRDGKTFQYGLWLPSGQWPINKEISRRDCTMTNPNDEWGDRGQFHIFRPRATEFPLFQSFAQQIRGWTEIYKTVNLPVDRTRWEYDPADFHTSDEIKEVASLLIRQEISSIPPAFCAQWVLTILTLALCIPLNDSCMAELGVNKEWNSIWSHIERCKADFTFNPILPVVPYSITDVINALVFNYTGNQSCISRGMLAMGMSMLALFKPEITQEIGGMPETSVLPIFPLWEYRKKRCTTKIDFKYIGTVFPDEACIKQTAPASLLLSTNILDDIL